ncbi:GTP-binding protein 1 [Fistulina hepatica ATCC 64428]|uniref:GTP-binding protein 1 n=1 Tax=Fistulina hepatica ATCC 64428 TaxID=1128425 RepID=A0A0D7AG37_9AGAR|nr:GTP-binding protein 1 [Fistulina hepatica ATCC 64428]
MLQAFQNDIQNIRHREVAKQRALTAENSEAHRRGDDGTKLRTQVIEKESGKHRQSKPKAKDNAAPAAHDPFIDSRPDVFESEKIMTLLVSAKQTDLDAARDLLAGLITSGHGEYVFRMGLQPPHAHLFAGDLSDTSEGWSGVERTEEELNKLRNSITEAVSQIGGKTSVLFETLSGHPRTSLLLRLPPSTVETTAEIRCAVVGNVDSGKSTTLGVLTRGALDDGRGRARVGLFRHKHEFETGRTSSVGMEILGFGTDGAPVLPATANSADPDVIRHEKLGWEQISVQSAKIISFSDLAGHERYLKTTLYGLTSGAPSCVILIVGGNAGLIGMSKEHLAIALALNVPVVVCITKTDMTPPNILRETITQVVKILRSPGCRKQPVFVESLETAVELATAFGKERLCPIFKLSNVTGQGLDFVRTFLNLLPPSDVDVENFDVQLPLEFSITDIWSVPYVGTVVNGIINSGVIKTGEAIMIGPDSNGYYQNTVVRDMQRKRATVKEAIAGQCVSVALKRIPRTSVRKGMVLVHRTEHPPRAVMQFEGQVLILYHNTTLQKNYQAMLHCGAIRQTVRIIGMDHPQGILRTGDRATVQFEFISHPEYIKTGMKLFFREGKTKGLGVITRLL